MQIIRVQSCKENPSPFSHQISTILFLLIQPDTQKLVNKCNKQGHPDNKQPKAFGGIFALRASSSGTSLGAHSPSSLSTELTILHWVTSCLLISMDRRYRTPNSPSKAAMYLCWALPDEDGGSGLGQCTWKYVQTQEGLQQDYSIAYISLYKALSILSIYPYTNTFLTYTVPLKSFTSMFISKDFHSDSIKGEFRKKKNTKWPPGDFSVQFQTFSIKVSVISTIPRAAKMHLWFSVP